MHDYYCPAICVSEFDPFEPFLAPKSIHKEQRYVFRCDSISRAETNLINGGGQNFWEGPECWGSKYLRSLNCWGFKKIGSTTFRVQNIQRVYNFRRSTSFGSIFLRVLKFLGLSNF